MELSILTLKLVGFVVEKSVYAFFDDALPSILQALGDNHYQTALEALRLRKLSQDPSRETTIAVSHLLGARNALQKAWNDYNNSWWFNKRIPIAEAQDCKQLCEVSCLLATCYHFLGERRLAGEFINEAQTYFFLYRCNSGEYTDGWYGMKSYRNTRLIKEIKALQQENNKAQAQLDELKKRIES